MNRDRLQILLLSHANPNIFFKGYTALHVAAETGSAESIGELIRYGADPKIRTKTSQETAIHLAATQGDTELFKKKIEVLLESDIDINARNFEGDTALHLAICRIGTVDAVEILLGKGASLESKGRHGRTPLQYAIFLEKEEIATALLNHKANIYCEDEAGVTPLHLAVSGKASLSLIERLIGDGSHINHENDAYETPLFTAATCKRWDVMRLLIDRGAECKPRSAALESRLKKAQRRPFFDMRIPWIS